MREDFRERMRERMKESRMRCDQRNHHGHIWTGVFILLIGVAAMLKATVTDLPDWVFSWQMLLIALGFFIGFKHGFKGFAWLILIIVGSAFLLRDVYPELAIRRYIWPAALIVLGAFLILRPRRKNWLHGSGQEKKYSASGDSTTILDDEETWSQDDFVDSTSIFGGSKKNILSKEFKGGDIVNIFGGSELNFSQADIKGKAELEITTIFGGTKLIVPASWEVKSEVVAIFGGLEDKRALQPVNESPDRLLLLKGTVVFGGIEIKSF